MRAILGFVGIMEKKMETTIWGLGCIVPLKYIEYGFGYIIIRSRYTPFLLKGGLYVYTHTHLLVYLVSFLPTK